MDILVTVTVTVTVTFSNPRAIKTRHQSIPDEVWLRAKELPEEVKMQGRFACKTVFLPLLLLWPRPTWPVEAFGQMASGSNGDSYDHCVRAKKQFMLQSSSPISGVLIDSHSSLQRSIGTNSYWNLQNKRRVDNYSHCCVHNYSQHQSHSQFL